MLKESKANFMIGFSKDMVQLMLKNEDIDINKTDRYGVNAFWIAAFYGNTQVMKLLIGKGVDLMCKN